MIENLRDFFQEMLDMTFIFTAGGFTFTLHGLLNKHSTVPIITKCKIVATGHPFLPLIFLQLEGLFTVPLQVTTVMVKAYFAK